jgi:hypothetical protein
MASLTANLRHGWLAVTLDGLQWLASVSETLPALRGASLGEWAAYFRDGGAKASKALVKACSEPAVNKPAAWAVTNSQRSLAQQWACSHCNDAKIFGSKQALAVHMARQHGVKVDIRRWVDDSVCRICLVDFGTRPRVIAHLAYRSALCRCNMILSMDPLPDETVTELDAADTADARVLRSAGRRPNYATTACHRIPGPLPAFVPLVDGEIPSEGTAHHPHGVGWHWHAS